MSHTSRNEPVFLDVNEQYELCRFPDPNGKWSLRMKLPNDDRAHRRYLDGLEAQMVEAALKSALSENLPQEPIDAELQRAIAKFPTWPTDPLHALAVLGEEFGELTKAMLQLTYEPHKSSAEEVREEALQTAAMALRLFRSLDRTRDGVSPEVDPPAVAAPASSVLRQLGHTLVPSRFLSDFLKAVDFHNGHGTPSMDRVQAIALTGEAESLLLSTSANSVTPSASRSTITDEMVRYGAEAIPGHWSEPERRQYAAEVLRRAFTATSPIEERRKKAGWCREHKCPMDYCNHDRRSRAKAEGRDA